MNHLAQKSIVGCLQLFIGLSVLLFVPAGTFDYWQAWVYLSVFGASVMLIFAYLYQHDPRLLERRLHRAEKDKSQQGIQLYTFMAYIGLFVLSSLDHRFSWSRVLFPEVMAGDFLLALGYFIIFLVLKANPFAATTIELMQDQKVVSTGPYALVRHPMYAGALVLLLGTPPALGSWWGWVIFMLMTFLVIRRLREEEKFLVQRLSGYQAYCNIVRYRLVPFIW